MQHRMTAIFVFLATGFQLSTFSRVLPRFRLSPSVLEFYDLPLRNEAPLPLGVKDLDHDLSVIITSSLIPTHPEISFVNMTIASLSRLEGLPFDTPIYVTVDGLHNNSNPEKIRKFKNDQKRLSTYIERVQSGNFSPFTNVQVLAMDQHRHISGSVNEALRHISSKTHYRYGPENHYIYLLQHDLHFIESVPHLKLIAAMRESPDYLRNIRFRFNRGGRGGQKEVDDSHEAWRFPPCYDIANGTVFQRQGLPFYATARWSDNNQLSTLQYYQDMIVHIRNTTNNGRLNLPMEWVLMNTAVTECQKWGQAILGDRVSRQSYLGHSDGRNSQEVVKSDSTTKTASTTRPSAQQEERRRKKKPNKDKKRRKTKR